MASKKDKEIGPIVCARSGCENTLTPKREHGRFCSDACRVAAWREERRRKGKQFEDGA